MNMDCFEKIGNIGWIQTKNVLEFMKQSINGL
jgi:hypothetical protein